MMNHYRALRLVVLASALGVALAPSPAFSGPGDKPPASRERPATDRSAKPSAVPPAVITVDESIGVSDRTRALPPAVININESVGVADKQGDAAATPSPTRRAP